MQNNICVKLALVIMVLLALLVSSAERLPAATETNGNAPSQKHEKQQEHRFGDLYSSKRRVPNASDPLHN